MKNNELLKSMPVSQPVSAESLLITTTKSNGKYKQRFQPLTPEHQDIIVIDLKKHLKSFIQDKDQAEDMITQYTCYYNAIKRWESNHKETEILHQLEISNLLEQLKNN